MKLVLAVCSATAAFVAAGEEWTFEVESDAPRVVSCTVGRDWPVRMATHDVMAVDANGAATPVPWILDTTGDQPELVFLAAGNRHFTLVPRSSQPSAAEVTTSTNATVEPEFTLEDVRGVLSDIARSGNREGVKSLLEKYGASKLSAIDPNDYAALLKDAEVLKNA